MTQTITHHYNAAGEEIDPTELDELHASKVSGVESAANGTPFLVMKSAQTDWADYSDEDVAALVADPTVSKEVKAAIADRIEAAPTGDIVNTKTKQKIKKDAEAGVQKVLDRKKLSEADNRGGASATSGPRPADEPGVSDAEVDAILRQIGSLSSDTAKAAKAIVEDPKQNASVKHVALAVCKGEVQASLHGADMPGITASKDSNDIDLSELQKAEKALAAATTDVEKEQAGQKLTLERLKALHERNKRPVMKSVDNDPTIEALKQRLIDYPELPADVKDSIGQLVTKRGLEKSFASEQQEKTNALVRSEHARVTASPQSASGVDPHGFSGKAELAPTGKIEPEPAAQLQTLQDELAEVQKRTAAGSITKQERDLREKIVLKELSMKREGRL